MTRAVHIVLGSGGTPGAVHARAASLLESYGFAPEITGQNRWHRVAAQDVAAMTFDIGAVSALSLTAPAWSPREIGAMASLSGPGIGAALCARLPMAPPGDADRLCQGIVLDGEAVGLSAPAEDASLIARAAAALGVRNAYLALTVEGGTGRIRDLAPFPPTPTAIEAVRAGGHCPVWLLLCLAIGRKPLLPRSCDPATTAGAANQPRIPEPAR